MYELCLDLLLESSEGFGEPEQLLDNSGSEEEEVEYSGEEDAYDSESSRQEYGYEEESKDG